MLNFDTNGTHIYWEIFEVENVHCFHGLALNFENLATRKCLYVNKCLTKSRASFKTHSQKVSK